MADNAGTIVHQTPTRNPALTADLEAGLKSTPLALGSAAVSEHISTVGVDVNNLRPWITRDVQNFEKCKADTMLQELLARCTGSQSLSASEKSTLLETSLNAVLPICNVGAVATELNGHLTDFCDIEQEAATYAPFVKTANCALRKLNEVNVDGYTLRLKSTGKPIFYFMSTIQCPYSKATKANSPNASLMLSLSLITLLWVLQHSRKRNSPRFLARRRASHPKTTFNGPMFYRHWNSNAPGSLWLIHLALIRRIMSFPTPSVQYMEYRKDTNGPSKPTSSTPAGWVCLVGLPRPPTKHRMSQDTHRSTSAEGSSASEP
ncbi:hypothetical protein EDD22DRAFT_296358 [Suillus occidentalis]|nr:hypothetical protein EDD22DRAFT_296358 [Suillus occidentalis]